LTSHADLRRELLNRSLQAAMEDPRPGISGEALLEHLKQKLASPREPAVWEK